MAFAFVGRGTIFAMKGDLDRAITDLDHAVKLNPDEARAFHNRGLAWRNKGDYDRAIADFDFGHQARPEIRHRLLQPRQRLLR